MYGAGSEKAFWWWMLVLRFGLVDARSGYIPLKTYEPNLVFLSRRNEARQSRLLTVWIEWTPCNYGGARAWFICPRGCGRRMAILYNRGHFGCRQCHQLAYESQRGSPSNRALHRAQEIRMKLGQYRELGGAFPSEAQEKGMRWSRFLRLYRKAMAREEVLSERGIRPEDSWDFVARGALP